MPDPFMIAVCASSALTLAPIYSDIIIRFWDEFIMWWQSNTHTTIRVSLSQSPRSFYAVCQYITKACSKLHYKHQMEIEGNWNGVVGTRIFNIPPPDYAVGIQYRNYTVKIISRGDNDVVRFDINFHNSIKELMEVDLHRLYASCGVMLKIPSEQTAVELALQDQQARQERQELQVQQRQRGRRLGDAAEEVKDGINQGSNVDGIRGGFTSSSQECGYRRLC